jgi:hypothetical protein
VEKKPFYVERLNVALRQSGMNIRGFLNGISHQLLAGSAKNIKTY